jgi:cobalt-zinc-cadmium efflux system protein
LRDGLHLLLDGVPFATDLAAVGKALAGIDGVYRVHDLHIWSLSAERTALSAHLVIDDFSAWEQQLAAARTLLHDRYDIEHITLQPELRPATDLLLQIKEPHKG